MDGTGKIEIEDYNEDGFWSKVKKYCKSIGKDWQNSKGSTKVGKRLPEVKLKKL